MRSVPILFLLSLSSMLCLGQTCIEAETLPRERETPGATGTSQVLVNLTVGVTVLDGYGMPVTNAPVYFNVEKKCYTDAVVPGYGMGENACNNQVMTDGYGKTTLSCQFDLRVCNAANGVRQDYATFEVMAYAPEWWGKNDCVLPYVKYADSCYVADGTDRSVTVVLRLPCTQQYQ